MDGFAEIKSRLAALERKVASMVRVGIVSDLDRARCRVRVIFPMTHGHGKDDKDTVSPWLPVLTKGSMSNREYWMPDIDDQVTCVFLPNDLGTGFALGVFYSDDEPIPEGADAEGMRVVEFDDGARFEYSTADSKLRILIGDLEFTMTPDLVQIGGEGATQPFVRGTDLKTLLEALFDLDIAHPHGTGVGPSGPPINASAYAAKKAEISQLLSTIIKGR